MHGPAEANSESRDHDEATVFPWISYGSGVRTFVVGCPYNFLRGGKGTVMLVLSE